MIEDELIDRRTTLQAVRSQALATAVLVAAGAWLAVALGLQGPAHQHQSGDALRVHSHLHSGPHRHDGDHAQPFPIGAQTPQRPAEQNDDDPSDTPAGRYLPTGDASVARSTEACRLEVPADSVDRLSLSPSTATLRNLRATDGPSRAPPA